MEWGRGGIPGGGGEVCQYYPPIELQLSQLTSTTSSSTSTTTTTATATITSNNNVFNCLLPQVCFSFIMDQ